MTDQERAIARTMYDLTLELFTHQGDEIEALKKANESLRRSHEVIGRLLEQTAKLMGVN